MLFLPPDFPLKHFAFSETLVTEREEKIAILSLTRTTTNARPHKHQKKNWTWFPYAYWALSDRSLLWLLLLHYPIIIIRNGKEN